MTMRYVRAMELLEAPVADEMVALDARGTRCFGFNRTAASLWSYLAEAATLDELMARFAAEYDVVPPSGRNEVLEQLTEKVDMGLVAAVPPAPDVPTDLGVSDAEA